MRLCIYCSRRGIPECNRCIDGVQLEDTQHAVVTFRATMEQMRRERDGALTELATMTALYERACTAQQAAEAMISATWEALGTIGRGRGVTLPERAAKVVAVRDALHAKLARIGETIAQRYMMGETAHDTIGRVLRIIDEKEGGQ